MLVGHRICSDCDNWATCLDFTNYVGGTLASLGVPFCIACSPPERLVGPISAAVSHLKCTCCLISHVRGETVDGWTPPWENFALAVAPLRWYDILSILDVGSLTCGPTGNLVRVRRWRFGVATQLNLLAGIGPHNIEPAQPARRAAPQLVIPPNALLCGCNTCERAGR